MRALPGAMEGISEDRVMPYGDGAGAAAAKTTHQHKGKEAVGNTATQGDSLLSTLFPTPSTGKGHYWLSTTERAALENLMDHGLCRVSKLTEAQVESVWKKVPLKEGGGQGLAITWKRISRFVKIFRDRVRNKDESMRRWDKWVDDHRQQARDGVTPPRVRIGEQRFKRCADEDTAYSGCETSETPRVKRSKLSAIDTPSNVAPDQVNTPRGSPFISDAPIPHPPRPILDPHLKLLYQPYLDLTEEQINVLAHLVRLGGGRNTIRDQHLISKIWLRVPQCFGGGLGLGVPFHLVKSFAHTRSSGGFHNEEGLTRWENWITRNRSNVVLDENMSHAYAEIDAEGDTTICDGGEGDYTPRKGANGVASAAGVDHARNQKTPQSVQGQPENQQVRLMLRATPEAHVTTQGFVPQLSEISHAVETTSQVHDVFAITQDIVSYLNRLCTPAPTIPETTSLGAVTQATGARGNGISSPHGNLEPTPTQPVCYPAAYQPRLSYSTIQRCPGTSHVQATDKTPAHSPAMPEVVPTVPEGRAGYITQPAASLAVRPPPQPGTASGNPWFLEDGSIRDWYWYPPGARQSPGGRIFEHWSSSDVPLQQFDPLRTHQVTLTIGRDPDDIASVLRGLEQWPEVKQVLFHGYQPQVPPTENN